MTKNLAEETPDKRLEKMLTGVAREERAIKTRQLLGGDNIVIGESNISEIQVVLAAFEDIILAVTVTPSSPRLVLKNILFSVFVDNDWNSNYLMPVGASLRQGTTAFPNNFPEAFMSDLNTYQDLVASDTNSARHYIHIPNPTNSSHTYFVKVMFLYPKVALA